MSDHLEKTLKLWCDLASKHDDETKDTRSHFINQLMSVLPAKEVHKIAAIEQKSSSHMHILPTSQTSSEFISIIKLLRDYSHHHDSRIRSTALSCIVSDSIVCF